MKRGDLVTVAIAGDFGKPRPAVVIQAAWFDASESVTVLLLSSTLAEAPLIRVTVLPTPENGLRRVSQVMIDRAVSLKRHRIGPVIGHLDDGTLLTVTRLLAVFLGVA